MALGVWLLASVLIMARAVAIHAGVFIAVGAMQIVATALIMFYAARYLLSARVPVPIRLRRRPAAAVGARCGLPDPASMGGELAIVDGP